MPRSSELASFSSPATAWPRQRQPSRGPVRRRRGGRTGCSPLPGRPVRAAPSAGLPRSRASCSVWTRSSSPGARSPPPSRPVSSRWTAVAPRCGTERPSGVRAAADPPPRARRARNPSGRPTSAPGPAPATRRRPVWRTRRAGRHRAERHGGHAPVSRDVRDHRAAGRTGMCRRPPWSAARRGNVLPSAAALPFRSPQSPATGLREQHGEETAWPRCRCSPAASARRYPGAARESFRPASQSPRVVRGRPSATCPLRAGCRVAASSELRPGHRPTSDHSATTPRLRGMAWIVD